jgi:hypothetical protein
MKSNNRPAFFGLTAGILVSILLLAAYVWIYQRVPFPGKWNDILLQVINFLASLLTTIVAVLVLRSYRRGDRPQRIWYPLAIGFACWSLSEIIWGVYYASRFEIPIPSLADLFWVLGYFFFTAALVAQFKVINRSITNMAVLFGVIAIYILIAINTLGLIAIAQVSINISSVMEYFYPVIDFTVGVAALILLFSFRGGKMAWPWVGMLVFSASDVLYAFLLISGLYAQSAESGNILSLVADTTYIAAYLVVMLGFLNYYLFIRNEQKTIPRVGPKNDFPGLEQEDNFPRLE